MRKLISSLLAAAALLATPAFAESSATSLPPMPSHDSSQYAIMGATPEFVVFVPDDVRHFNGHAYLWNGVFLHDRKLVSGLTGVDLYWFLNDYDCSGHTARIVMMQVQDMVNSKAPVTAKTDMNATPVEIKSATINEHMFQMACQSLPSSFIPADKFAAGLKMYRDTSTEDLKNPKTAKAPEVVQPK